MECFGWRFVARGAALLAVVIPPCGLFKVPEPELIYSGAAPGLTQGVEVLRDAETWSKDIEPLDPDFGGAAPDLSKRAVLRIVSRPLENECRDAELQSVSTRGMTAEVMIVEKVPEKGCTCPGSPRPPRAWLVTVGKIVRKASLSITDVVVPCATAQQTLRETGKVPTQLFEGSWDSQVGAQVIADSAQFRVVTDKLQLAGRAPQVDFKTKRVVVVTGRARENSCRQTRITAATIATPEEAVFEVEESYPTTGQMCAQVMGLPRVFIYAVPATVERVKTTVREKR